MIVSIESEYYIGDEVLYETTAIKDRVVVPVFMLSTIQSITISCPNGSREYCLKYEIDGNKFLNPQEIRGHTKSSVSVSIGNSSTMRISFESEYYIGDEVLYETTAIKDRVVVPVFMLSKIKSINISPLNSSQEIAIKYELEDGSFLSPKDIRGHMKSQSVNLF